MKGIGKRFTFWAGDVDYLSFGGVWARRVGSRRYHFIRLENMDEACGSDNEGQPTYAVELCEVDLDVVPARSILSALRSYGPDDDMQAEARRDYGLYAPLHNVNTNNARRGIAECRRESYRLTSDGDAYEEALGDLAAIETALALDGKE